MINIEIAKNFVRLEDLDNQIEERRKLKEELVGTLWPSVLNDELFHLERRRVEIVDIVELNFEYYGKGRNH